MEQARKIRNKPKYQWSTDLQQWRQEYMMEKRQSLLISGTGKTGV